MAYAPLSVDGQRRLGLPIAGLAVGDVVELAYSIERAEPLLGGHHELVMDAGTHGGIDRLLLAARWDGDLPMAVAGRNLPAPLARGAADVLLQSDAPLGPSKAARLIEFSDFAEWGQVAGLFQPLFAEARRLAPASPLRARSSDPGGRRRGRGAGGRGADAGAPPREIPLCGAGRGQSAAFERRCGVGAGALPIARARPRCCWRCWMGWALPPNPRWWPRMAARRWTAACPT
jgi:hypothetical protein